MVLYSLSVDLVCILIPLLCLFCLFFPFLGLSGSQSEVERLLLKHDAVILFSPSQPLLEAQRAHVMPFHPVAPSQTSHYGSHFYPAPSISLYFFDPSFDSTFLRRFAEPVFSPLSHHCLISFAGFDPALSRRALATSPDVALSEQPGRAALPRVEGLCRPDPHPRRDPHQERHEDAEHLGSHVGVVGAGLELSPVRELVEVTADDGGGRHRVQYRKYADLHHQALQLVCFGAVLLQIGADLEEGHKACTNEQGSCKKQMR